MQRSFNQFLIISIILISLGMSMNTQAQPYGISKAWRIGAGVGATKFYGDLTDNANSFINNTPFSKYFYQDRKLGYSFFLEKSLNPYFGIRGMFFGGKIKSTQESSKQYFEANYFDYSLSLTMDFTNMIFGDDDGRSVRFFGFAGIGLSESRTWKYDMNTGNIIATNGFGEPKREGEPLSPMTEMVYPIGLGVSLFANEDFNLNIEGHLHMVSTNKLDATPVPGTKIEMVGFISVAVVYNFSMNGFGRRGSGSQTFEGRSNDPSLREFNKRKRVVMRTKYNKNSFKKRRRFKHQRR